MTIDHQLDVGPDRLPHGGRAVDAQFDCRLDRLRRRARRWKAVPRRGFDGLESLGRGRFCRGGKPGRRARVGGAIHVGVAGKRTADRAAEERAGRHVQRLASQIPQRLFDGAEGGRRQPGRPWRPSEGPQRDRRRLRAASGPGPARKTCAALTPSAPHPALWCLRSRRRRRLHPGRSTPRPCAVARSATPCARWPLTGISSISTDSAHQPPSIVRYSGSASPFGSGNQRLATTAIT